MGCEPCKRADRASLVRLAVDEVCGVVEVLAGRLLQATVLRVPLRRRARCVWLRVSEVAGRLVRRRAAHTLPGSRLALLVEVRGLLGALPLDVGHPVGRLGAVVHVILDLLEGDPHLLRDPGGRIHELRRLILCSGLHGQRDDHIREHFRHVLAFR